MLNSDWNLQRHILQIEFIKKIYWHFQFFYCITKVKHIFLEGESNLWFIFKLCKQQKSNRWIQSNWPIFMSTFKYTYWLSRFGSVDYFVFILENSFFYHTDIFIGSYSFKYCCTYSVFRLNAFSFLVKYFFHVTNLTYTYLSEKYMS